LDEALGVPDSVFAVLLAKISLLEEVLRGGDGGFVSGEGIGLENKLIHENYNK